MASIAIAASVVTPGAAFAADGGPDPAPAEVCSGGWRKNVYGYKATHIGKGPVYKDGPGGTMVITRTTAEKVGSSVTGTAGVTVDYAVAQAKAEISRESAKEVSWGTDHQYRRNVASGRYGNTQYGSWGHSATWEKLGDPLVISLSRGAATAAIVIATVATVVGCTKTDTTEPLPPAPSGSPSKPVSDVKLTPPEIQPGYRQVAADGPRRGAWDLGAVTLTKGVSWVNVNCVADSGTGKLVIAIDTVGEFTVDCPSTEARISVNQLDLAEGRKGRFHIEADKHIRWSASLQVAK